MTNKEPRTLRNKLIIYRIVVLSLVAYLLVHFDIVNNSNSKKDIGVYIFALIVSLPITMILDKYLIRFAKKY
jgi:hypothetical protein